MKKVITARLESWYIDPHYRMLWGYIFNDTRGRWRDGTRIHTSDIPKFKRDGFRKGMKVQTLNSVYLLGEPLK